MVNKDEIKLLAELARMEISDSEAEGLTSEVDSIIDYVGKIKEANIGDVEVVYHLHNVLRDDEILNKPDQYTEDIINNAPKKDGRFIAVKKIL